MTDAFTIGIALAGILGFLITIGILIAERRGASGHAHTPYHLDLLRAAEDIERRVDDADLQEGDLVSATVTFEDIDGTPRQIKIPPTDREHLHEAIIEAIREAQIGSPAQRALLRSPDRRSAGV